MTRRPNARQQQLLLRATDINYSLNINVLLSLILLFLVFYQVLRFRSPHDALVSRKYNVVMETGTALTWGLMLDRVAEVLQAEQQQQRSGSQQHEEPQRPEDRAGPLHDRRRTQTA